MRSSTLASTIVTALVLAACGGGGGDPGTTGDDDGTTDVDAGGPPAEGFRIETPPIRIEAGQEITYCYYTTLPTTRTMGIKKWSSTMTPGSHHLILFFDNHTEADGTIKPNCGFGASPSGLPFWTYSAQTPEQSASMPPGVGMTVNAGQKAFVQMHYLNATDQAIMAHVTIDAEAYGENDVYTPAAAYVTYNTQINVAAHSTGSVTGDCAVPAGAKFFAMSTHSHHFSTHTEVKDGGSMIFESTNWEHPGAATWNTAPYFTFASGKVTYHCDYNNDSDSVVKTGDSAQTDEMCMAVGYFFPATAAKFCLNSFALP
ncbi:MAG TPA: hypothetical protein VHE35_21250 [Kofleriaceae bacterium]|nr:hypothetical protein [Kofleriaceae bacterium]